MNDDLTPEYEPTFSLDRQIAGFRAEYDAKHGAGAWDRKVAVEWGEAERIERERKRG